MQSKSCQEKSEGKEVVNLCCLNVSRVAVGNGRLLVLLVKLDPVTKHLAKVRVSRAELLDGALLWFRNINLSLSRNFSTQKFCYLKEVLGIDNMAGNVVNQASLLILAQNIPEENSTLGEVVLISRVESVDVLSGGLRKNNYNYN